MGRKHTQDLNAVGTKNLTLGRVAIDFGDSFRCFFIDFSMFVDFVFFCFFNFHVIRAFGSWTLTRAWKQL